MTLSRRDFIKLVGVSVASLALTRCNFPVGVTCYAPMPPSPYPTDPTRDCLRTCWLSFGELARRTQESAQQGDSEDTYSQELKANHRAALDELVASGELTASVADLVQEAYNAAVYHVWRSNTLMTCYEPMMVDYAPVSANILVDQAAVLDEIAAQGMVESTTLETARAALEHDMAFYAMTDEEVSNLYSRLVTEWQTQGGSRPAFEELDLEITPDAQAAAQFIISLLTDE